MLSQARISGRAKVANSNSNLLKIIHDTKAVSIWNHATGPVFWYAASVPGPVYVNTERVIGPELAEQLLKEITAIMAGPGSGAERTVKLDKMIMEAYRGSTQYQQVIAAMATKAAEEFPSENYDYISGGERRDWLFSIPLAHAVNKPHIYLFKDQTYYCDNALRVSGVRTLHVADLINNAASYFDAWFPILAKGKFDYIGTMCVNIRGYNGLNRLQEHGKKTITLNHVDQSFFDQSLASGLINHATRDEIELYFSSQIAWAERYLMTDIKLYDVQNLDTKSFERLVSFFKKDPWSLRPKHENFFDAMHGQITQRQASA